MNNCFASVTAHGSRSGFRTLLLALASTTLFGVQQSSADQGYSVPDNIAPAAAPGQPLPYSHKTHLASGLTCANCHTNPDPGLLMTYPATDTCVSCHELVAADKPAIASLMGFAESGQEIPWVRVYAVTPGVTWGHRAHLDAGAQCETCHGDMSETEAVAETKAVLAMATCIDCHEAHEAPAACVTCHAWPDDRLLGIDPSANERQADR